jgi:hypothetical protein
LNSRSPVVDEGGGRGVGTSFGLSAADRRGFRDRYDNPRDLARRNNLWNLAKRKEQQFVVQMGEACVGDYVVVGMGRFSRWHR